MGGMMSVRFSLGTYSHRDVLMLMHKTWNKFCFTGGLVETSVTLPGASNIRGYAITVPRRNH